MKSIFKSVLLLGVMFAAYSCVLDDIDTQITDEEAIAKIKLECNALESYTIQASKPQAVSFRISSTTPWTIEGADDVDWITVSPSSSSESSLAEDIRITVSANSTYQSRSATLTVTGRNTEISYPIQIVQNPLAKIEMTPLSGEFERTGGSQSFTVKSNLNWSVSAADSWLTFSPANGEASKSVTVKATAAENPVLDRSTTVTLVSGDVAEVFTVNQKGNILEWVPVDSPSIDRRGGDILLEVNSTMDWTVECDEGFTATKEGDKAKVSAGFNNLFVPRKFKVYLKPANEAITGVKIPMEISQDVNFEFSNVEQLSDGSVKILGDKKSRITTKDAYRYVSLVWTLGDRHIGEGIHMCCETHDVAEYQCQIILGSKARLRTNGSATTYNTASVAVTEDNLKTVTTYRMDFLPDGSNNIKLELFFDGVSLGSLSSTSGYAADKTASGYYFLGYEDTGSDASNWYVVKSCDLTVIPDPTSE